jgi:hypothetical protein
MIDTQLLNDALATVGFVVALVVAISAWILIASAIHERHTRRSPMGEIEQHLAEVAEQLSPVPTR